MNYDMLQPDSGIHLILLLLMVFFRFSDDILDVGYTLFCSLLTMFFRFLEGILEVGHTCPEYERTGARVLVSNGETRRKKSYARCRLAIPARNVPMVKLLQNLAAGRFPWYCI